MATMQPPLARVALLLTAAAGLAAVSGGNCTGLTVDVLLPGGGSIEFNTVKVELYNATAYPIEPRLFVDVEDDSWDVDADENRVYLDAPIEPGQLLVLTMACADTGAIETDHAVMLIPFGENIESDNDPVVRRHDDFDCGDIVRFTFVDEPGEDFHTLAEVNGYSTDD